MYIAKSEKVDIEFIHSLKDEQIIETSIGVKDLLNYCNIDIKALERNLKKMNETSITIFEKKDKIYMNILPYIKHKHNGIIELQLYSLILKMTHSLEAYSMIDVSTFMCLKSVHSIRMLMVLERIKNFSASVAKRKRYSLDELNEMFDTKYKNIPEFSRRVLKVAKEELDEKSKITFEYSARKDKLERTVGRAKVVEITIDLINRSNYQPSLMA